MKKIVPLIFLLFCFVIRANAQMANEEYVQEGEFGITAGAAHYFGDLNNRAAINRPKIALGAFFRKQFGNYTSLRITGHFAQLGYSDKYSKNEFQQRRNLSFNTNIFEIAARGDFNFFKFNPTNPAHSFTPYATIGVGIFSYDPYAFYNGEKIYLRPLNTEGETFYQSRKAYGTIAHRFTTTDYIDDVSKTYIGIDKFPSPNGGKSVAAIMQDRSFETGTPIGIEGRQRGFSKQKDQYAIAEIGISFNITSYRCPSAR